MKSLVTLLMLLGLSFNAMANDMGFYAGLNMTEIKTDTVSYDSEIGFDLGMSYIADLGLPFLVRTGAGLSVKNSSYSIIDVSLTYLEVPATAFFKFNDQFAGFAGLNFLLNVADDCEVSGGTCTLNDPETFVMALALGTRINLAAGSDIEVVYEKGLTEVAEDVDHEYSFGARYVHSF